MKSSKFTDEQITFALRQAETGTRVAEVCRKTGVSEAAFYNWKKKYGGLGVAGARRLKQLEEENSYRPHPSLGNSAPEEFAEANR